MIPLSSAMEADYREWLLQKHPSSLKHYLFYVRSLARFVGGGFMVTDKEVAKWIDTQAPQSRGHARKGLRKYVAWAQSVGFVNAGSDHLEVPCPRPEFSEAQIAGVTRRRTGSLKDRQTYALFMLHRALSLSAAAIGKLRFEHFTLVDGLPAITWNGVTHPLPADAARSLQDWIRIRGRLKALPEERRRHRKSDGWAESDFLFPNPRGGASRFDAVSRIRRKKPADENQEDTE